MKLQHKLGSRSRLALLSGVLSVSRELPPRNAANVATNKKIQYKYKEIQHKFIYLFIRQLNMIHIDLYLYEIWYCLKIKYQGFSLESI